MCALTHVVEPDGDLVVASVQDRDDDGKENFWYETEEWRVIVGFDHYIPPLLQKRLKPLENMHLFIAARYYQSLKIVSFTSKTYLDLIGYVTFYYIVNVFSQSHWVRSSGFQVNTNLYYFGKVFLFLEKFVLPENQMNALILSLGSILENTHLIIR